MAGKSKYTVEITTEGSFETTTERVDVRTAEDVQAVREGARFSAITGDTVTIKVTEKR